MRRRSWTVQEVDAYDGCRLLTLRRITDDGATQTRCVLHPFDDVDLAVRRTRPSAVGIEGWRAVCRTLLADTAPAAGLRAGSDARIDLLPYQLEPALALLHGLGCRVLIADDVGLGKTVQAMLALAELRASGAARRALIVCPAGLREQWADECANRFALQTTIFDQPGIRRRRAASAALVNPWVTEPIAIASVDFIKRPEVLPTALCASWDLVIVDEAHGACGDSDRRAAVAELTARAAWVILLTATPHNGDEAAFASLCGLGRLDRDPLIVFRRSRSEVGRDAGRRSHTLGVRATPAEHQMHLALARLTAAVRRDLMENSRDAWLLLSLLHKRALSSPFALAASTERRLDILQGEPAVAGEQLLLPLDDGSGEFDGADMPPMWSMPLLHDRRLEGQLLTALLDAARAAQEADGKLARLCRLVRIVREPLIVFTEYRDTLSHVRRRLGRDAAILHGGMSRDQRREALRQFTELGILLATDAAGEGLNLQEHCRLVVNLELPWNPMRLEQRIGRVDRIGQRRRVHAIHLIGADTREMLLLDRLMDRIGQARARVRAASPLCGRPEWTEELSARLVVGQEDPRTPPDVMSAPPVPLTRLTSEGEAEARRIAWLRRWRPPGASSGRSSSSSVRAASAASADRGPLAARARRCRTRTALQGRSLLVFRTTMRDGAGRTISTRVDGVMTRPDAAAPYEASSAARDAITLSVPFREWVRASADAHARLVQVRARRAAAIAARLNRVPGEQQPGLFERRDERIWRQVDELHSASLDAAAGRVAQIHAAETTSLIGPELELLLVPQR